MDTQTLEPSDIETCAATLPTTNAERLLKDLMDGRNYIKRQFDVYDKAIPRIQPLLAELSETAWSEGLSLAQTRSAELFAGAEAAEEGAGATASDTAAICHPPSMLRRTVLKSSQ